MLLNIWRQPVFGARLQRKSTRKIQGETNNETDAFMRASRMRADIYTCASLIGAPACVFKRIRTKTYLERLVAFRCYTATLH